MTSNIKLISFKIYVENALKRWKRKCRGMGVKMNGKELITLQFADDQVIISEIRENLQKMTEEIRNEYNKWGLTMNMSKTKYLCIGEDQSDLMLSVSKPEYLSSRISL